MVKKEKSIKSRGLYGPIDNFAEGNEEGEESLIEPGKILTLLRIRKPPDIN